MEIFQSVPNYSPKNKQDAHAGQQFHAGVVCVRVCVCPSCGILSLKDTDVCVADAALVSYVAKLEGCQI